MRVDDHVFSKRARGKSTGYVSSSSGYSLYFSRFNDDMLPSMDEAPLAQIGEDLPSLIGKLGFLGNPIKRKNNKNRRIKHSVFLMCNLYPLI